MTTAPHPRELRIVLHALEDTFYVNSEALLSRRRTADLVFPRQLGITALIEQFGYSCIRAAEAFQRHDHGTALHARRAVRRKTKQSFYHLSKAKLFVLSLAKFRQLHADH